MSTETCRVDRPNRTGSDSSGAETTELRARFKSILESRSIDHPVHYHLDRRIGLGRQGVVFRAFRTGARRCETRHAVKVFDPALYTTAEEYWEDMGRISAQVADLHMNRSPNLAGCDFYEESGGIGYVQMELIDGINLHQLLEQCPGPVRTAGRSDPPPGALFNYFEGRPVVQPGVVVYIMRQILAGLETLHSTRYLHCDLKPANLMVDAQGYVRVIDFGRAHRVEESSCRLLGTPSYAAPETHRGGPVTVQSDLYAVGLVGLELLRGRRFIIRGQTARERLLALKLELLNRLESMVPPYVRCNGELMSILARFLDPDPSRRFGDARSAESGAEGLAMVHRQLTRMDIDSDYRRVLAAQIGARPA